MGNLSSWKEIVVVNRARDSSCIANIENKRDKGKSELHLGNSDLN